MTRRALLLITLAALFVAGCAVNQKEEIARYRRVIDIPTTRPSIEYHAGEPLTLRRAMLLANTLNERLSIEGETYLQAIIDRRRAVASFLPTVNLAPRYTLRDRTTGGGDSGNDSGTRGGSSRTRIFDVPIEGQINVFNGLGDAARLRGSALNIVQRRALLQDAQEQLLLDVAEVFYQVLRSEESVRVLVNSLSVQEARLRDVRGRQSAGVVRPLDVAQVDAQASATRVSLIAARSDVANARALLAFLTVVPVAAAPLSEEFNIASAVPDREALLAEARDSRRDLQAAQAATRAAREQVRVAFAQYYPSIALDLNVFAYRESSPTDRDWDALLRANIPIFSAGVIRADVRSAWSQFRQAALNESLTLRQVARDVEVGRQDVIASTERFAETRTQLGAAEAAFAQADESNAIGLATNLERLIAQDQLLNAQLQLVSGQFARKLAYLNLLRVTGSLRRVLQELEQPTTQPSTHPATHPATHPPGHLAAPASTRPAPDDDHGS